MQESTFNESATLGENPQSPDAPAPAGQPTIEGNDFVTKAELDAYFESRFEGKPGAPSERTEAEKAAQAADEYKWKFLQAFERILTALIASGESAVSEATLAMAEAGANKLLKFLDAKFAAAPKADPA